MKTILCIVALLALANAEYPSYGTAAYLNDNNVLQYALTLENLEYAYYTQALNMFNQSTFAAAGVSASAYAFIKVIQGHEMTHVSQLSAVLQQRGVSPVQPCNYTFTNYFTDVPSFIVLATALEETGVRAYDGAIGLLTQTDLVEFAGSVATIEARHAAFLNTLNMSNPFPNALDLANTVASIFSQAGMFFNGSCTYLNNVTSATYTIADAFRNVSAYNGSQANTNDYNVLQYALTLEILESHFYNTALSVIQPATFAAAGVNTGVYNLLTIIQQHENAHVQFLKTFLTGAGVTPVTNCTTYKFDTSLTNDANGVAYFFATGAQLESGGVSAYLGALPYLTSESLISIAATIVTVEARHASFLNTIGGQFPNQATNFVPFPTGAGVAEDPSYTPAYVLGTVLPLFASGCPNITTLVLADTYRANITGTASSSTSSSSSTTTSSSATASTTSSTGSVTGTATGTRTTSGSTGTATVTGTVTTTRSSSATKTVTSTSQNSDASVVAVSVAVMAALALVL